MIIGFEYEWIAISHLPFAFLNDVEEEAWHFHDFVSEADRKACTKQGTVWEVTWFTKINIIQVQAMKKPEDSIPQRRYCVNGSTFDIAMNGARRIAAGHRLQTN